MSTRNPYWIYRYFFTSFFVFSQKIRFHSGYKYSEFKPLHFPLLSAEAGSALSDEESRVRADENVDSGKAADKSFLGVNNNLPYDKLHIGRTNEKPLVYCQLR
eukprot:SAG11_NODE_1047_length_6040_cov_3.805588_3_plen_103_part_00